MRMPCGDYNSRIGPMSKTHVLFILFVLAKATHSTKISESVRRIRERYETQKALYKAKQAEFLATTDLVYGTDILNEDEIIKLEKNKEAREILADRLYYTPGTFFVLFTSTE